MPMFIVRHKDTKFDGTAPALQYGMSDTGMTDRVAHGMHAQAMAASRSLSTRSSVQRF